MFRALTRLVDSNEKNLKKLRRVVAEVNALEPKIEKLTDAQLKAKTEEFRKMLDVGPASPARLPDGQAGGRRTSDELLPEAFAVVREAAKRTVGERTWDEQIMGAAALHLGMAAELKTGEGKTLTAVHALYLNALGGQGAHLVTVNDYLSRIQAEGMALILNFLGLSVGCLNHEKSYIIDFSKKLVRKYAHYSQADGSNLIEVARREAYGADVTYGTNNEFGFDYLRDNLVRDVSQIVQSNSQHQLGSHHYTIVDEIDSILIDEARTPLIISSQAEDATSRYQQVAALIKGLVRGTDYEVEEKHKTATLTELGIRKLERMFKIDNLYEKDFQLVHLVEQSLKAHTLFAKDKDYILKDGEVIIVDEFTGRLMPGRRYSDGLHQAIEAKEGVAVQRESKTVATVSFQNYFRMYEKLSGMSGTVITETEEFRKIYNLEAVVIPTHEPVIRKDRSDLVFKSEAGKWRAVAEDIVKRHETGQPVLVGTTSVEKNELLGKYLKRKNVPHQILNAKQHEKEGRIIAEAGRAGAVTVATNMAGRGVDIILGGTKPMDQSKLKEWKGEHEEVLGLGGLYVIGTDRHESRRIDNQLRGRSGRHGEPGESRFYVSLQDDLMRIFGGEAVERMMGRLGIDDNTPIEAGLVSKSIEQAQKRVEGYNFDVRKHLVEYDDVMDQQRKIVYGLRRRLLGIQEISKSTSVSTPTPTSTSDSEPELKLSLSQPATNNQQLTTNNLGWIKTQLMKVDLDEKAWQEKLDQVGAPVFGILLRQLALPVVDTLWMEHLTTMDDLREGVGLQAYGQKDPLVEYRQEGRILFEKLLGEIWGTVAERVEKVQISTSVSTPISISNSKPNTNSKGDLIPPVPIRGLSFQHQSSDLGVSDEAKALSLRANPDGHREESRSAQVVKGQKVGRNDPCPCGSGKKYKKCHGR